MMIFADCGSRRSTAQTIVSAPWDLTSAAVPSKFFSFLATSTITEKSVRAGQPWLVLCLDLRR